ncbi:leucine-rich repeat containing protein [Entamoeba histolytica HM-1:IMSS-B]|uniref:Leucine-rich repeat containing protein n=5 Tax=Entamoeba histolytica TaxID=5759 RepID=C4M956_ENTH1|nr:uncharacterized protein EHI_139980 [Entamoeba histolytica HM-1:IMSS]EMH73475.1 leucine-rich repeat containing protein [Entamoeba histolytica HM-1:IMSS-B]EMS18044.1 F-box/leucine rich repeat protein [Entamoeba histolytica HM-3:IMSS]ENY60235.1 F-box/leucine rich repeat protein [Entamoeba histolytica HM-1:IMSS-A]GAT98175.1 leucine-rich repeat containing protein [Entamoeba histolytica]EAL44154.1 leucine-rich repeat containing protein [Entamoeba histolytica HM-1:IMSS]|eukprot:XP_649540.1 uncharacterized protein EHI_139980 [Entamoeba histolytica HM-1:IMSS]
MQRDNPNNMKRIRRKMMSLNIPTRPFLLTENTGSIIPTLSEIILDSFGRFEQNFSSQQEQTPIALPPVLASKLIYRISNNPNASESDLNIILFRILSSGTPLQVIDLHHTHLLTKFTCMNLSQLCNNVSITTLNISYATGISSESLKVLFRSFKQLKYLNTEACVGFDDNAFISLLTIHPPLEVIVISNCPKISDKSVIELKNINSLISFKANNIQLTISSISVLHGLKEIELMGNNCLDDQCLLKISQLNPDLTRICFGNSRLSDEALQRLLQQLNGNLISLNLSGCTRAGPMTLAQLFNSQFKLKYLNLANCFGINGDSILESYHPMFRSTLFRWLEEIEYLNISGCIRLSEEFITTTLIASPQLRSLILDDTAVTDQCLQEFIQSSITYNQTVRRSIHTPGMKVHPLTLSLKRCIRLTDNAYTNLFQTRGVDLISLNLSFCNSLSSLSLNVFSLYSNTLTSFYASNNDMISEYSWLKFIASCPQLRVLFLSNNRGITNEVINQIKISCPLISHLDISSCLSINQFVIPILCKMQSLEYIDISFDVMINEDGIISLVNSLTRLSTFCMQGIAFKQSYLFTEEAQWLNSLKLNFIPMCGDDVMRNIASYCPLLTSVELRMCSGVTDNGIEMLLQKCTKISHLVLGGTSISQFKMMELVGRGLFIA